MRRILTRLAVLLLTVCRGAYCCLFFFFAFSWAVAISSSILRMVRTHSFDGAGSFILAFFFAYSIVCAFAWWTIFTNKPSSRRWAIAGNVLFAIPPDPSLILLVWHRQGWHSLVESERSWWVATLVGIFGMIVFSIPYHGWRHKEQIPAEQVS